MVAGALARSFCCRQWQCPLPDFRSADLVFQLAKHDLNIAAIDGAAAVQFPEQTQEIVGCHENLAPVVVGLTLQPFSRLHQAAAVASCVLWLSRARRLYRNHLFMPHQCEVPPCAAAQRSAN